MRHGPACDDGCICDDQWTRTGSLRGEELVIKPAEIRCTNAIAGHIRRQLEARQSSITWAEYNSHTRDAVMLSMSVALAALGESRIIAKAPADWWEAVKERWAPRWFLRRWPVQQKVILDTERYAAVCPHIDLPMNSSRHHYRLLERQHDQAE